MVSGFFSVSHGEKLLFIKTLFWHYFGDKYNQWSSPEQVQKIQSNSYNLRLSLKSNERLSGQLIRPLRILALTSVKNNLAKSDGINYRRKKRLEFI